MSTFIPLLHVYTITPSHLSLSLSLSLSLMGNSLDKLTPCFSGGRRSAVDLTLDPHEEGLGHSFCYVRPDFSAAAVSEGPTTYRTISGAAVSANAATALSTDPYTATSAAFVSGGAAFESSTSFFSVPLQPVPRFSGPLSDRGFLSGPIERSFLSGPIDEQAAALRGRSRRLAASLFRRLSRALGVISSADSGDTTTTATTSGRISAEYVAGESSLHWAQGKAGEDRVHVVVSDERRWLFVGIYDGFNGPDATDYLLSNLYPAVQRELKGLLLAENQQLPGETHGSNWEKESFLEEPDHDQVLKALSRALKKTEEAYLNVADKMATENPELALMGSCVLVMLMKGKDVYLMNVGDSRAVLAQTRCANPQCMKEEASNFYGDRTSDLHTFSALQLTLDHSTCVEEEVQRIKREHPDDASAIANDRVKGYLKVTRAFGAGFLKQYLTNEEAVALVELFMETTPEGDPAQQLVEEVLFRAAKKAGMDFHELLQIPQGDRRRFHDDVSVIVITLEGRIWRSFM
ncbi:putative protein phosphatase 2C 23 [Apostasia shenzhenica]|uniref:protein-serine/threonine phosphatase n=1 Tax=Apostasia shenzhenica TaxID=1088818 RepID=A0A2H9ZZ27_9ASPA|nr:putative protein phosphatase 2C 23 [Apostasia shenzhenica]